MSPAFFGLNFEQCTRSYVLGKTLKATKCTCSSSSKELELPRQVHTYILHRKGAYYYPGASLSPTFTTLEKKKMLRAGVTYYE